MKKILDLRFVIGAFFTITGLLLFVYSFGNQAGQAASVNRWCGVVFSVFGIIMVLLSFVKDAGDELTDEGI